MPSPGASAARTCVGAGASAASSPGHVGILAIVCRCFRPACPRSRGEPGL